MKKTIIFALLTATIVITSCNKKDEERDLWNSLWREVTQTDARLGKLETICTEINTNISSLQIIIEAQQTGTSITKITPIMKDGAEIGYEITFSDGKSVTIYHGKDGAKGDKGDKGEAGATGAAGATPIIGVAQDADGIYYWTLNGTWLLDGDGHKIRVTGEKGDKGDKGDTGATGATGQNGTNGTNGTDGVTPQLKIQNDYWYISYDNGSTWTQLGKAKGDKGDTGATGAAGSNGTNGQDGQDGDSMFQSVTQDENNVYFTLADGTIIAIGKTKGTGTNTLLVNDSIIVFADFEVKKILLKTQFTDGSYLDGNFDGEISIQEAARLTSLGTSFSGKSITSFNELQLFENLQEIKASAFSNCTSLISIVFPQNLEKIGAGCFAGCSSLRKIIIPKRVQSIEPGAFKKSGLLSVVFEEGATLKKIRGNGHIFYDNSGSSNGAFADCVSLTSITLPASIELIDSCAFMGCTKLKEVVFETPSSLKMIIGGYGGFYNETTIGAFWNCPIEKIVIPSSVIEVKSGAFNKLEVVEFEDNSHIAPWTFWSLRSVTYSPWGNNQLTSITSPDNMPVISSTFLPAKVSKIYLHSCVQRIDGNLIADELYMKSITPPMLSSTITATRIYVPSASYSQYINAPGWSTYAAKIQAYNY